MSVSAGRTKEMEKIQHEVTALTNSPIYTYRTEHSFLPVVGEGSDSARVFFIGEAPGKNEARTGRPFCGTAGKMLDEFLESIHLTREEVYITNIVKDRPPENRDPTPEEISCYAPFLDREIAIIKPKVMVTLGRYAMNYVMKRFGLEDKIEPISVAHGKTYQAKTSYGEVIIAPQYHPAAAIYNRSLIETLRKDFKSITKIL